MASRETASATGIENLGGTRKYSRACGLDDGPRLYRSTLGDDDDAVANVVAVAVGVIDTCGVGQARAIADPGVLVHDHSIENDIAANAERQLTGDHIFLIG